MTKPKNLHMGLARHVKTFLRGYLGHSATQILQNGSLLIVSKIVAQIAILIRGTVVPGILGPQIYGIWKSVQIVLSYSSLAHLGVLSGLSREVPYLRGKGDTKEVQGLCDTAASFCMLAIGIVASVIFASAAWIGNPDLSLGLFVVGVLAVFTLGNLFNEVVASGYLLFGLLGARLLIGTALDVVVVMGLSYIFGASGFYTAMVFASAFSFWYVYKGLPYRYRFRFHFHELKRLLHVGFPLVVNDLVSMFFRGADNLLAVSLLGTTAMGYYGLALVPGVMVVSAGVSLGMVISPRLIQRYGESDDILQLRSLLERPLLLLAYGLPILVGPAVILCGPVVRLILPAYVHSIQPMRLTLISYTFLALLQGQTGFYVALLKQKQLVLFSAFGGGIVSLLGYVLIKAGWGLTGLALSTVVAYGAYALARVTYAYAQYMGWWQTAKATALICLPMVAMSGILAILGAFDSPDTAVVFTGQAIITQNVIFLLLYSPFAIAGLGIPLRSVVRGSR